MAHARPHTVIRMGAGIFRAATRMGEMAHTLDLRKAKPHELRKIAGILCEIHGIKAHRRRRASPPRDFAPTPSLPSMASAAVPLALGGM